MRRRMAFAAWVALLTAQCASAAETAPIAESWDYATPMRAVTARFQGRPGVVLHVGDSITYANPYGQWARSGAGRSPQDMAVLKWMHAGADDETDGWWLARFDHPDGGRSHTAAGGLRADELLAGGPQGLPALESLLRKYRPQLVVLMIGANDVSADRRPEAYEADLEACVGRVLDAGAIPILSTIPPHPHRGELAKAYNERLRSLAARRRIAMIDFEGEILRRRRTDWNGTLLGRNDVHPTATAEVAGADGRKRRIDSASEPTGENLRSVGYLLRGWLSVRKIAEVKALAIDPAPPRAATKPLPQTNQRPSRAAPPANTTPPDGLRLPVTRDNWVSAVGNESQCNLGGAPRLKLKSIQEMSLVDIDPRPLAGRVVRQATLHLRTAGNERLGRVSVGGLSSPWVEGTQSGYRPEKGSSCFARRQWPDLDWAFPGSDLTAVVLGQGGSLWRMADATDPDSAGWQQIPVDPQIIGARIAGLSEGFLLFDDTGSEWTRRGDEFRFRLFPNRFVYSRHSGPDSVPYFTIVLGAADTAPPAAPRAVGSDTRAGLESGKPGRRGEHDRLLPAGEAWLWWTTPADEGPAGTLGFFVEVDGKPAPRYLVPPAGAPGRRVTMRLRDLGLKAGAKTTVAIRAVDAAGNIGSAATAEVTCSDRQPVGSLAGLAERMALDCSVATAAERAAAEPWPNQPNVSTPGRESLPVASAGAGPRLGSARVAVVDALDKVHPHTGATIPRQPAGYFLRNSLWRADRGEIRLSAARNEFVEFQIVVAGSIEPVRAELRFGDGVSPVATRFYRFGYVATKAGPLGDPLIPLATPAPRAASSQPPDARFGSLLCECYVPHAMSPGLHRGTLTLRSGGDSLELKVALDVWRFTLPDRLSFLPEMNCYGLPVGEREYYRLAHEHRTVLNRVPYSQNGAMSEGCAPSWDGKKLDWIDWDKRFGPYFDGSAFADLPRKGAPIECFYLPMHENWPVTMESAYNGDYWADRAFPAEYRAAFVEVSRQFAEHASSRGWHATLFQGFLNNKNNFKQSGWSRGSSPWLLDEPAGWQDYWALRFFGEAFHEGVAAARGAGSLDAKLVYRCDISRPQWQRDALDHVLDYNVVSNAALRQYGRIVRDRKEAFGQIVVDYGSTNGVEETNMQPVGWCLESWALGSDGVIPWQTVGNAGSWKQADSLSLFYPGEPAGCRGPVASIRLKAYRRAQQDVEYLTLLAHLSGEPRWSVGHWLRRRLNLQGRSAVADSAAQEDAGIAQYDHLLPQDVWRLRREIAGLLDAKQPTPRPALVDFATPPRTPSPRKTFVGETTSP